MLYYTTLYYTILYYTILYYTILGGRLRQLAAGDAFRVQGELDLCGDILGPGVRLEHECDGSFQEFDLDLEKWAQPLGDLNFRWAF